MWMESVGISLSGGASVLYFRRVGDGVNACVRECVNADVIPLQATSSSSAYSSPPMSGTRPTGRRTRAVGSRGA